MISKLLCVMVAALTIQLAELLNFSVPWVYPLQNGDNNKAVETIR